MNRDLRPELCSNAALAYLGDAVLELMVRERLVREGHASAASLNAAARDFVTAPRQAQAMERILPLLDEWESGVYRRGRNNVHAAAPKHATVAQYRAATGMECLFAALHLAGRTERLGQLFEAAFAPTDAATGDQIPISRQTEGKELK